MRNACSMIVLVVLVTLAPFSTDAQGADGQPVYLSVECMKSKTAGHEALIADGHRAGWAVYSLISPVGSSIPYNYGTADFVNELGPVPRLLKLREGVLSETWELVTATD